MIFLLLVAGARDHGEPDRDRDAGAADAPGRVRAAAVRPVAAAGRGRGAAAVRQPAEPRDRPVHARAVWRSAGCTIPAASGCCCVTSSANRDPARFPDAGPARRGAGRERARRVRARHPLLPGRAARPARGRDRVRRAAVPVPGAVAGGRSGARCAGGRARSSTAWRRSRSGSADPPPAGPGRCAVRFLLLSSVAIRGRWSCDASGSQRGPEGSGVGRAFRSAVFAPGGGRPVRAGLRVTDSGDACRRGRPGPEGRQGGENRPVARSTRPFTMSVVDRAFRLPRRGRTRR